LSLSILCRFQKHFCRHGNLNYLEHSADTAIKLYKNRDPGLPFPDQPPGLYCSAGALRTTSNALSVPSQHWTPEGLTEKKRHSSFTEDYNAMMKSKEIVHDYLIHRSTTTHTHMPLTFVNNILEIQVIF
jgi:hypothetical protein